VFNNIFDNDKIEIRFIGGFSKGENAFVVFFKLFVEIQIIISAKKNVFS
jgi:hypothetical protein